MLMKKYEVLLVLLLLLIGGAAAVGLLSWTHLLLLLPIFGAIAYTGTNRNDLYIAVATRQQAIANIKTSLEAASWTSIPVNANASILNLVPGPGPLNGQTVVTDVTAVVAAAKTYTFVTGPVNNANPGEVLIGVDVNDSMTNLKKAINLESGGGVKYSSATTANLAVRVPASPAVVTTDAINIEQITAGMPLLIICSTNGSNWIWNTTGITGNVTLLSQGYKITSAVSPEFQQLRLLVYDQNETNTKIRITVTNLAETEYSHGPGSGFALFGDANFDERIICNPYQCFIMVDGVSGATPGRFFAAGVPQIPSVSNTPPGLSSFLAGIEVTGATNASPIVITTANPHGLATADQVTIRRVQGNLAANVTNNPVTVLTPTTYELDGTAGDGVMTPATSGVMAYVGPLVTQRQICEAIWAQGTSTATFRSTLGVTSDVFGALNGSFFSGSGGAGGSGNLQAVVTTWPNSSTKPVKWWNSSLFTTEPVIAMGQSLVSDAFVIGQLWDAVWVMSALPADLPGGGPFDGHNWWCITDNNTGGLSLAAGSLLVVVP